MSNELLNGPRDIWATVEGESKRFQLVPNGQGSFQVVDPESRRDYTQVEAEELGIFHEIRENSTVLRSEFLFEWWRTFGNKEKVAWEDLSVEDQEAVNLMSGEDSYFREAIKWWVKNYGDKVNGLYDWVDLEKALSWGELGYFLFLVLDMPRQLDWRKLDVPFKVAILKEFVPNGKQRVQLNLIQYKSSLFFSEYIMLVKEGKRFLPFPLIASFEELRAAVPEIEQAWVLREISRGELQKVLTQFTLKD